MGQIFLPDNIPTIIAATTSTITLATTFLDQATRITIGGRQYRVPSTLTLSTGTSGFNGLDTGSIAANTNYFVYAVTSGGAIGLVASTADPLTGPTGFSVWTHVGSFTTNTGNTDINTANSAEFISANLASIFNQATPALDGTTYYDAGLSITVPPGKWDMTAKITGDLQSTDTGANLYGIIGSVRTSANVIIEEGNVAQSSGDGLVGGNKAGAGVITLRFYQEITSTTVYKISTRIAILDNTPVGTINPVIIRAVTLGSTSVGTRLSARRVK